MKQGFEPMPMLARLILATFFALAPIASVAQAPSIATSTNATPPVVSAPVADPKPGTFVTVKDGAATVSGGSLIGEIIMWAVLLIGAPMAGVVVAVAVKFLKKMGVDVSDADRARLQEMVENGLALAAQRAQASLKDKLPMETRSKVAIDALQYVQDHGAETIKKLGFDPADPKAMEALQARIAKAMDDKVPAAAPAMPGAPA